MPNKEPTIEGTSVTADNPKEACQAQRNLSWERETRKTTLATLIKETASREIAKANVQYTTWIKGNCTTTLPGTLKINSEVNSFKVMDPFDWTQDRNIFQHWQIWSEKAKNA